MHVCSLAEMQTSWGKIFNSGKCIFAVNFEVDKKRRHGEATRLTYLSKSMVSDVIPYECSKYKIWESESERQKKQKR